MSDPDAESQPDYTVTDPVDATFAEELDDDVWQEEAAGPSLISRMLAEAGGTFVLVFLGVGTALFANITGLGMLGTAFGFAVGVAIAVLVFGGISGAHVNPAVTLGAWLSGRFPGHNVAPYMIAQIIGGVLAGGLFFVLRQGNPVFDQLGTAGDFMAAASNGFGESSPTQFGLTAVLVIEVIISALFVAVVLAATSARARAGAAAAPLTIGLSFGFLMVVAIPFSNGALNPVRATSTAVYAGMDTVGQLWVFWLAPLIGAAITGMLFRAFGPEEDLIFIEQVETIAVIDD